MARGKTSADPVVTTSGENTIPVANQVPSLASSEMIPPEPTSFFDNPPLSSSDKPFPETWDDEDDAHVSSLVYESTLPAEMINPTDALGEDDWDKMVLSDIKHGGAEALAAFRYQWDFVMTPAQKAKMLSDVAFSHAMEMLVKSAVGDVKQPVDPYEYAEHMCMKRKWR